VIGRLGGIGARPEKIGLVSDGDGAVAAVALALKLGWMAVKDDRLPGDVVVATHICPRAPTAVMPVVTMMSSPVDMATMNREEVRPEMEAILSIDTTRGNRVINHRGIAISATVKAGWILRVSEDLITIMQNVTGRPAVVFPLTMQDVTPYGNGLYHINSILQPSTATEAPVVGVALTAELPVPGSATGASHATDIDLAVRFCLEVAKAYGKGECRFLDQGEWDTIQRRYGSMAHLQTLGRG
jgi:microcompartment protein CcmL/EutN